METKYYRATPKQTIAIILLMVVPGLFIQGVWLGVFWGVALICWTAWVCFRTHRDHVHVHAPFQAGRESRIRFPMKASPRAWLYTAITATVMASLSFHVIILDDGSADKIRNPLYTAWLFITAVSLFPRMNGRGYLFIRRAWWLQIIMPVAMAFIAEALIAVFHKHLPPG